MEVHLSPDTEASLNEWATKTGRATDDLIRDAVAGYVSELADLRGMLDGRFDDISTGRIQPIDGEEAFRCLRE